MLNSITVQVDENCAREENPLSIFYEVYMEPISDEVHQHMDIMTMLMPYVIDFLRWLLCRL